MYSGYLFVCEDRVQIYNLWSILCCLSHPHRALESHWLNRGGGPTSANLILRDLLFGVGSDATENFRRLLEGESLERAISELLVLRDMRRDITALWSFLLFSGYLWARVVAGKIDRVKVRLEPPNREVRSIYARSFVQWLESGIGSGEALKSLVNAMLEGDSGQVEGLLEPRLAENTSFVAERGEDQKNSSDSP